MNRLPDSLSSLDVLEQLSDAVIAIDLEGVVLFWNRGAERLYEWSAEEAIGQSANELLNTRSAEPIEPLVDSLLRDGRWEGELTRSRRSGEPIDVLSRWSLLRDAAGSPIARILIDSDLTETRFRFHELRVAEEAARKKAESLARREALLTNLIDGISDYAYLKDTNGRYLAMNAPGAKFLGMAPKEIVGKTDFEIVTAEQAAAFAERDRETFASGGSITFEEEVRGVDDTRRLQTIKSVCRDAEGRVLGLVGVARDLTERLRMEAELRERERQVNELHRASGIGIWRYIVATDTVEWSEDIYRIFKLDRSQRPPNLAEMRQNAGFTPSEKVFLKAFERAVEFGEPYELDIEVPQPDGSSLWTSSRCEVEAWDGDKVASLRGTVLDITQRKRQEQQLALSENRYRSLVRAGSDIVWVSNAEGNQMHRIPEWQAFTGQSDAEVLGFGWAEAIHPDDRERCTAEWLEAIRKQKVFETEHRLRRQDGVYRNMTVRAVPVRDAGRKIVEWVGVHTDITEKKEIQRELEAANVRLQNVLDSITDGLAILDRDLRYTYFNRYGAESLGLRPEDIVGKRLGDFFPSNKSNIVMQEYRRALETGVPVHFEVRHDAPLHIWAEVHGYPSEQGLTVYYRDITERKRTEQELSATNRRLNNVLESITDGLAILDHDLRYTYFNESGGRISEVVPTEMIGKRMGDVYPEIKDNPYGVACREALATGQPGHLDMYYPGRLGKWIESHFYPSEDGVTIYYRDVSDRKRTEDALRRSESRFRQLFESDLMGICIPDRFGGFKEGSNEFLRIVGYTREELNDGLVRWDRMTPPEYAAIDAKHIAEAELRGSCTPYEKEYIRKDGTRVPILCGYALLEGSKDEYIAFVLDISRQRAAEAELREREERFRVLADSLPELVWVNDRDGTITYRNSRFLEFLGIDEAGVAGLQAASYLHPDEVESILRRWRHALATGEPCLIEMRMRATSGEFRYFLSRAVPIRNAAGEIERWVGSCTDVHDQKLSEEALRRSEKLAATGRLAASIAHEINNPLSSVTNALYLALQDEALSDETRGFLRMAEQELSRITHITTQTLRFHRQSKAAVAADLAETMNSVLILFGPRLMARNIEVNRELEEDARLECFEDELRQVFANLISNSLDASQNHGLLRIRIRKTAATGREGVRVTVADTGNGIPAKARARIFEPFFSTKDTTGIGLGLWVSDGIIRKHAGRIQLRSWTETARHGTVMSLFFPVDGLAKARTPTS